MTETIHPDFQAILAFTVHEMKNSLGIINELIQQLAEPDKRSKELLWLEFEADRLNNNLVQLMLFYKIDVAKFNINIDEHLASDLLTDVAAQQNSLFALNNLQLELVCPDDLLCYCDENLVSQALGSLVHNCQRYARKTVRLSAAQAGDYVVFELEDDGEGLPPEMLETTNLENNRIDLKNGSTGLGLYFVSTIAHMHSNGNKKGYIKLSNDSALGGAKFSLYIP